MSEPVAKQNLSAEQWAEAALDAMASSGLEAVSVEPLARRLGVTKGSFYWHFANRDALVRAALELWERHETTDAIALVRDEPDPYERIVKLFKRANTSHRAGRLYLALAAASDDPAVGAVVQRVSAQRLAYLQQSYQALGLNEHDARLWSTFAYATFIGNQQVHRDAPEQFPSGTEFREYFKLMLRTLIPHGLAAVAPIQNAEHPHVVSLHKTVES
ncbi:MAG: TetR/AcrR family transcriptional regulator [Nevskia sp.]|nr:TetR/AcrR family transcriptional regulator [Nevskia sp.]